jgi:hypothetical protein
MKLAKVHVGTSPRPLLWILDPDASAKTPESQILVHDIVDQVVCLTLVGSRIVFRMMEAILETRHQFRIAKIQKHFRYGFGVPKFQKPRKKVILIVQFLPHIIIQAVVLAKIHPMIVFNESSQDFPVFCIGNINPVPEISMHNAILCKIMNKYMMNTVLLEVKRHFPSYFAFLAGFLAAGFCLALISAALAFAFVI